MLKKILSLIAKKIFQKKKRVPVTLDTYLDVIGHYTDRRIAEEEKRGNRFTGGECTTSIISGDYVKFQIKMYFIDENEKRICIETERTIYLSEFDEESQRYLSVSSREFDVMKAKTEGV